MAELCRALTQHGVSLALTPDGKLKPTADQPPPAAVVESIKAHRVALVRRLERGQHPDGRLNASILEGQPGRCVSCGRWQGPDAYGDGLCILGRGAHGWLDGNPDAPVLTGALHVCAAHNGQGWQVKQSRGPLAWPSPGSPSQGLMRASPVVGQVSLASDSQRATEATVQR